VGSSAAGLRQGRHEAEDQNLGSTYNATVVGESAFDAENARFAPDFLIISAKKSEAASSGRLFVYIWARRLIIIQIN
jgi:hypothetical protein